MYKILYDDYVVIYINFVFTGSFICDLLMDFTGSDACLINSGTFRSDMIHKEGEFRLKDLGKVNK